MNDRRLARVLSAIDEANALDPNSVLDRGAERPAELVYGERMSEKLQQFQNNAPDHLRIAVRGQHIERWKRPRDDYPAGREGYLRWRSDLKVYHAQRVAELMRQEGCDQADIDRVSELVSKKGIKRDLGAQAVEDVACLVFLEFYAADFIDKHDDEKIVGILRKTARKMSPDGIAAAAKLVLSSRLGHLLSSALGETEQR